MNTSRVLIIIISIVSLNSSCQPREVSSEQSDKPNIIFILADDMGYGDVQILNPDSKISTPNLNRIAAEGMIFSDAHTPSSVCTPTRYGLLTGRYCWRSSLKRGVLNGYGRPLIEVERPTIASVLKSQGYVTGIVGKWHLGLDFTTGQDEKDIDYSREIEHGPNQLGFNYSYIIPASLDFPPYVYLENGIVTAQEILNEESSKFPLFWREGPRAQDFIMEETLDHLLEKAVGFIHQEAQTNKPFFLYFPLTAPHKPVFPHERFEGESGLGPYGDFIAQVDWTVGEVLSTLDELGISKNTLLVYTSDNGSYMYSFDKDQEADHVSDSSLQGYHPDNHKANNNFRGTKADIWEAGHRVPFLVRWPAKIQTGSRCDKTICLTDFFATAAEVSGAIIPDGGAEDSYSFLSLLLEREEKYSRPPVIHHSVSGMFAIRDGKWKLVLGNGSGGREKPAGSAFERPYTLFDLHADDDEANNLYEEYPEIAAKLEESCLSIAGIDSIPH